MRIGLRWIEQQRFVAARADDDDLDEVALYLAGADHAVAQHSTERRLTLVAAAGGEVA